MQLALITQGEPRAASEPLYYGRHQVDEADTARVLSALHSGFLSQGPLLKQFEERAAKYCGAKYAIAVSNGTAALHLALAALGLGEGDIGWTTPLSFVASANAVRYTGAAVDFTDIEIETYNLSVERFEEKLKAAERAGALPKVFVPVHFAGASCDMAAISALAEKYGVRIVEDACHALGGEYRGKKIGCCEYSDLTVFSLHPVKSITSGEGGLILTNDKALYDAVRIMRTHGTYPSAAGENSLIPPWQVEMHTEGYNCKITELQCALGVSQFDKLDRFIEKRRRLADLYQEELSGFPVSLQKISPDADCARHIMSVRFDFKAMDMGKRRFYDRMKEKNIHLAVHYYPIHLHRFYQDLGFEKGMFPMAEAYYDQAFTLPLHPGLKEDDVRFVCDAIKNIAGAARNSRT